ncbi:Peptide transporter family 1 [Seminavis robusta]|uniref:Peptide transporter family 1 n=1 Tax=Seminavis robusta TaxID=568900 RepID=A0A9N8H2G3_9STRA|nr:Peptide transporter family 1 [Seminavis robusta]|eukprot:Sro35_g022590.1 Peptide transporter family 1 (548) ;mRNA; r:134056-135699
MTSRYRNKLLTPVIWCILATEFSERFCYYGFRGILTLYFTVDLGYDENRAIAMFALTTALAYLSPMAGSLMADGHWGRYRTIMVFGSVYVIGMILLTAGAFLANSQQSQRGWTMVGLFLVCLGTGGIKPCVSSFGADQVGDATKQPQSTLSLDEMERNRLLGQHNLEPVISRDEQVRAFFAYFYFSINFGALSSLAIVPLVRSHYGFGMAFLIPTLFMITAMALFVSMHGSYVHHVPESSLSDTFVLCWWLIKRNTCSYLPPPVQRIFPCLKEGPRPAQQQDRHLAIPTHDHESDDGREQDDGVFDQKLNDARQAVHILPIMTLLPIFWCLYDQQGSVWTLQATRMELNGLQPEQLNIVNPLQIMILIPLFDQSIYPWLEQRRVNIRPLRRMACGMLLAAGAFVISGWVESAIQNREAENAPKLNVFWQIPQITLLSIAEILVSVTGLEFAYATSPDRLKAFLMGLFLLTTSVGDFFSGFLYSTVFVNLNRATIMHICGSLMLGNLVLFARVSWWWEEQERRKQEKQSENPSTFLDDGIEIQEQRAP